MQTGLLFLMAAIASATKHAAVVGVWRCTTISPGGDHRTLTLEFHFDDGRLTGTASGSNTLAHLTGIRFDSGRLSFLLPEGDDTLRVEVELEGDQFRGQWICDGRSGSINGFRGQPAM